MHTARVNRSGVGPRQGAHAARAGGVPRPPDGAPLQAPPLRLHPPPALTAPASLRPAPRSGAMRHVRFRPFSGRTYRDGMGSVRDVPTARTLDSPDPSGAPTSPT